MRIFLTIFFVSILTLVGCDDTAELNLEQRDDIISYLTGSHTPKLVSQSDAEVSQEINPAFYSTAGQTTFMYVETFYDELRDSNTEIVRGSTISITYTLYDFEAITTPTITEVLRSNDADVIADLESYGLNTTYWSSDYYTFKVGSGALIGSIEAMLIGCRKGDIIEFYMTLDEAYGTSIFGLSTLESPLALYCKILEVN